MGMVDTKSPPGGMLTPKMSTHSDVQFFSLKSTGNLGILGTKTRAFLEFNRIVTWMRHDYLWLLTGNRAISLSGSDMEHDCYVNSTRDLGSLIQTQNVFSLLHAYLD